MTGLHPFLTHFPIALFSTCLLFEIIGLITKKEDLVRFGWWMQLTGTIGLAGTILSGLLDKSSSTFPDAARSTLEIHEQMGFAVATLAFTLILWRVALRAQLPRKWRAVYLLILALMVALMWVGAWHGGELAHTFGTEALRR
jgi:uncharacterized membrane protein